MTLFILIGGLGESATGEGQGLKLLAESLRAIPGADVKRFTERQGNLVHELLTSSWGVYDEIFIVGHSYGGDEAIDEAARVTLPLHLFLLDPVRKGVGQVIPRDYRLPQNIVSAVCYRAESLARFPRSSSISITRPSYLNIYLPMSHNEIPNSLEIQNDIITRAREIIQA